MSRCSRPRSANDTCGDRRHSQLRLTTSRKCFYGPVMRYAGNGMNSRGVACTNLEVERLGQERPGEIILVGAHYDTVEGSPGADDNASGVAGDAGNCAVVAGSAAGVHGPLRGFRQRGAAILPLSCNGKRGVRTRCSRAR